MWIICLVAVEATPAGITEFYRLPMTTAALRRLVRIPQHEIRKGVIEGLAIELDDVRISPFVISVTMGAFLLHRIRLTPVKSLTRRTIRSNVLVARQAQSRLRFP